MIGNKQFHIWPSIKEIERRSLTLVEEGDGQHQAVQRQRRGVRGVDDQRRGRGQAEKQVHGGVLPVHQQLPVLPRRVVEAEPRPARRKLLCQHPWRFNRGSKLANMKAAPADA